MNVLQLDVLQLEFALLQQAQRQGVPGVGDRRQPLQSLRQLLHHLQIPVAPHAPLGNAGNEAFYTVLAFQKLLMRDTRLPDQLFMQPQFVQPEYFAPPPIPQYAPAAPYSPYGNLPMPPPLGATGRMNSSPSLNRTSLPPISTNDFEPPSFPAPLSRQATGELASGRARPATMAVSTEFTNANAAPRQPGRGGAAAAGGMPRSQTVYWDDAEYSSSGSDSRGSRARQKEGNSPTLMEQPRVQGRGSGSVPPSSLRHSQVFSNGGLTNGNGNGGLANSRSVSFHEDRRPPTIRSQGSSSGQSKDSASLVGSRSNSGTALGPSGLSSLAHASQGSGGSGSGSASSGLASEASSKVSTDGDGTLSKKKSDKNVKHITGALAKFWVD